MTRRVRRHGDAIRMELEPFEVDLLRTLRDSLRSWLTDPDPEDPVIQRLFPRCVPEDDLIDAEVRALIYDDLLRDRLGGLDALVAILDRGTRHRGRIRVDLVEDEPGLVLGVLNDIRLALGARIGIDHLDRDAISEDHPAAWPLAVMDHLAYLQHELLAVIDPPSVAEL